MNKVILVGNLGKDPELTYTQTGTAVAKFAIAVNERWKDANGESKEKTIWVNIVAWRGLAELCGKYLAKGRQVLVEGKLDIRAWEDNDGNRRQATEINASNIEFLGGPGGGAYGGQGDGGDRGNRTGRAPSNAKNRAPNNDYAGGLPADDDDIPF